MNTSLILTNLLLGPTILLLGLIIKIFPPKNINWAYGYRSNRSKKSQETWDFANRYSNELMIWVGIATTIAQIVLYQFFTAGTTLLVSCIIMCSLLVGMIFLVEKQLKDNFDKDGKRKT